jgi:hypothetical protein
MTTANRAHGLAPLATTRVALVALVPKLQFGNEEKVVHVEREER